MERYKKQIKELLMSNYERLVPKAVEKWPDVFLPQVLVEFTDVSANELKVTFHIGVEEGQEGEIKNIYSKIQEYLGQIHLGSSEMEAKGLGAIQKVAVNTPENVFLQQNAVFVIKRANDPSLTRQA